MAESSGADVVYTIGADASQYEEVMSRLGITAQKSGERTQSAFSKATTAMIATGAAISASVTAPLVAVGKHALNTAVNFTKLYESSIMVFQRMLGGREAAQGLYTDLLAIAKASTYSQETFLNAGKTLVGMGADAQQTTVYMQAITDAVSAFGGSAEDIEGLASVFGKVMTNGRLTGESLEQFSDRGINALAILADQAGVSADQMRRMISEGSMGATEALQMLCDGIEHGYTDATGRFVEGAEGMAAALKGGTLTGALDSTNSAIRAFSLELIGINPTLKSTDEAYEANQERLQQLIAVVSTANQIIPKLAKVFAGVTEAIGDFLSWLVGAPEEFAETADAADRTGGALDRFNEYLDKADPENLKRIGNAIAIVAAAGPGLTVAGTALKGLKRVMDATQAASTKLKGGIGAVKGAVQTAGTGFQIAREQVTGLTAAEAQAKAATTGFTAAENAKSAALAVGAGATNLAAAALRRLSAAISNNPIGAVMVAATLAVPVIMKLKDSFDESVRSMDDVNIASQRQSDALAAAESRYESIVAVQGEGTMAAQNAAAAVEEERSKYEALDITFGELREAIDSDVEAQKRLHGQVQGGFKEATEGAEAYNGLLEVQEGLTRDQIAAQEEYDVLLERWQAVQASGGYNPVLTRQVEEAKGALDETNAALEQNAADLEAAKQKTMDLASRSMSYYRALVEVRNGNVDAGEAAVRYGLSEEEAADLTAEAEEAMLDQAQAASESKEKLAELVDGNADLASALERSGTSLEELAAALDNSGMSVDDFGQLLEDVTDKTRDAFNKMEEDSALSVDQLIDNLNHNAEYTASWGDSMRTIMERTGAESTSSFMTYLRDLGPEYAETIGNIANASDDQLAALVAAWIRSGDASAVAAAEAAGLTCEEYATALETGQVTIDEALAAADQQNAETLASAPEAKSAAEEVGGAIADGMATGIDGGRPTVEGAVAGMIQAMQQSVETAAISMEPYGAQVPGSVAAGIASGTASIVVAMTVIAMLIKSSAESVDLTGNGVNAAASFASGLSSGIGGASAAAAMMKASVLARLLEVPVQSGQAGRQAATGFASGIAGGAGAAMAAAAVVAMAATKTLSSASTGAWSAGYALPQGMAQGIRDGQYLVVSASQAMAAAALRAAQQTLQVNSPSKAFRRIGRFVDQGAALGIYDDIDKPVGAVIDMALAMGDAMGSVRVPSIEYGPSASPIIGVTETATASWGQVSGELASVAAAVESLHSDLGGIISDNAPALTRRQLAREVNRA